MRPGLLAYLLRRLLLTLPVLFGVIVIAFGVTKLVPGDPLAGFLPENPTPEQYQARAREFGLDRPVYVQLYRYVIRALQGNLGRSLRTGNPVVSDLKPAIAATLELTLLAFALTLVIGVPMGIYVATKQGRPADLALSVISLGGLAAPIFWTALMAQVLFFGILKWLPLEGRLDAYLAFAAPVTNYTGLLTLDAALSGSWQVFRSAAWHLVLPASVLAYRASALIVRLTRSAMLEVLSAQYIWTARAIGLPERRVVLRWAFRNALLPVLTVLGLTFGQLLQGSIVIETVCNWPGVGLYTIHSIERLDHPGVIAASLVISIGFVLANTITDLLYPLVDPRVRLQ
ncbi:ABC transporter permease [bacterium]|nr:ABC transporter permease [bacterium]